MRRVCGVAPDAGAADAEFAVTIGAGHCGLGCKQIGGAVYVGAGERAAGRQHGVGFGQAGAAGAADDGGVVAAGNGDGDDVRGAVGRGHGDGVGVVGAQHKFVVCAVHDVGPDTGCADAEFAVGVVTCHIGLRHEGCRAVQVSSVQGAAGALRGVGLGQAGSAGTAEGGGVIAAGDGDGDDLGGAVGRGDGDAVGVIGAGHKFVVRRVCGVAPDAGAADAEFAVTIGAGHCGLGCKQIGGAVYVGAGERAAGRQHGVGFGQAGAAGAADDGGIIGAGDVDADAGAGAINGANGEAVAVDLVFDEFVVGAAGAVGPVAGGVDAQAAVGAGHGGRCHVLRLRWDVAGFDLAAGAEDGVAFDQGDGVGAEGDGVVVAEGDRGAGSNDGAIGAAGQGDDQGFVGFEDVVLPNGDADGFGGLAGQKFNAAREVGSQAAGEVAGADAAQGVGHAVG